MTMVGLLLAACFIKVDAPVPSPEMGDTAAFVRDVEVEKDIKRAVWTVTGLGVFRVYINGREVGANDVLKPGFTGPKRKHSFAYDVTGLLRRGTNRLAAEVTAGWWRDAVAVNLLPIYATPKASGFYGMLELEYADGTRANVEADPSWRAAYAGQTVHADIYDGEIFDARRSDDWKHTGADDWPHARHTGEFCGVISPLEGPPICLRRDLTLTPQALYVWKGVEDATETQFGVAKVVRRYANGDRIVLNAGETLVADFGQNAAGVPEFMARAARGVRLTGHPAEMLNDSCGEKNRGNDGPAKSAYFANYRRAKSRFEYCFSGVGEEAYRPQFTFFGGRYFSITADGTVEIFRLAFVPQMSVAAEAETGSLETGREDVNRLIANCLWGMRSNYLSVPTDCPQRDERLGWAGDTQVFSDAAVYAADVYAFLSKWMSDMRDGQGDDWKFPDAFPSYAPTGRCVVQGHLFGWSDAGVIVPWRLWKQYGDNRVIRENWLAMQRFVASVAETDWVVPGQPQCADWLSDEKFERWRIDKGDGLRPGETREDMEAYWRFLGLCYLIRDFSMMREMSAAIGKTEESVRFARHYEQAVARFRARHLEKDGMLPVRYHGMQTPAAFVLTLGLNPDDASKVQTVQILKKALAARGNRMSTGFLGTTVLLDALADAAGDPALAYSVLLNHDFPGWLYSVDQGATTIWERWNSYTKEKGFGPVSMNSFNHYAYGAVLGWMYRTMAGIRPGRKGGYKEFVLSPKPDRRVGWVKCEYRSAAGMVKSSWRYEGDEWIWEFTVPDGTTAQVFVPGEGEFKIYSSGHHVIKQKQSR